MARIWSRWDSTTRVRRIYLDSVKFCADLVGHMIFNTNFENWKTVYVSEY